MEINLEETTTKSTEKNVLLYSGGMDSYIISKLENFDTLLYIDSKSKYSSIEIEFLRKQKIKNLIIDNRINLSNVEFTNAIVPLRNLHFINIATYYGDRIVLGALSGDRSTDKDHIFASKIEDLLNYIYQKSWWCEGRNIKIDLKYKNYTKKQLIEEYVNRGFNIDDLVEKSFSCYTPVNNMQCGKCKPCTRKWISLLPYKNTKYMYYSNPELIWKDKIKEIKKNIKDPILSRGIEDIETLEIWKEYIGE